MADVESDALQVALRDDLRRFWSRLVYFVGMLAGFLPLITAPVSFLSISGASPAILVFAQVLNAVTVLPASALAYWKRRAASIWLVADAAIGIFAVIQHAPKGTSNWVEYGLAIGIPLFLGGFGLITEWMGWVPLLEPAKQRVSKSVR